MKKQDSPLQDMQPGSEQQAISARRRLVRGAFAAPAALTLLSGSASATSSNSRCLVNKVTGVSPNVPEFPATPAGTGWVRVQRYRKGTSPNFRYYVRGADVEAWKKVGQTSYLVAGQFQKISGTTFTIGGDPGGLVADGSNFVALRFDVNGNIVGVVGTGTANSSAIAGTCWSSFRA